MKKVFRILMLVMIVCALSITAYAKDGVSVSTDSLVVEPGASATFTITASNAAGRIDISVSDPAVATVSEKTVWMDKDSKEITVNAIKNGKCEITVKYTDVATYQEIVVNGERTINVCVPCETHTYSGTDDHVCDVCGWNAVDVSTMTPSLAYQYAFYTGNPCKPGVTVKDGDTVLEPGKDYTVTYTDNVEIGVAKVTITGKNAYCGSKELLFEIRPCNVGNISATSTKDSVTLTWSGVYGGAKYAIFQMKDGNWVQIGTTDDTSYTVTGLTENLTYRFCVRPFVEVESTSQRLDDTFSTVFWASRYSDPVEITVTDSPDNPPVPGKRTFDDVLNDAYYYDAVEWAAANGIAKGTSERLFSPNDGCTRGAAVTFLYRAAGSPEVEITTTFSDVSETAYYAKAVSWAVQNNIVNGVGEGKFAPDEVCTRAHIITMISRYAGIEAGNCETGFSDVRSDAYYAAAVKWAVDNEITNGTGDNTFSPNLVSERAHIVTFLWRFLGK